MRRLQINNVIKPKLNLHYIQTTDSYKVKTKVLILQLRKASSI